MNMAAIIFFFRRALDDIFSNKLLHAVTIITISLSILIVSAFGLFFININDIINSWKNGVRIMAYVAPDIRKIQIPEIEQKIIGLNGVASTRFISKENALKELKLQMKRQSAIFDDLKENPLPDVFEIRMTPQTQSWEKVEALASQVEKLPHINGVEYGRRWLSRVTGIFNLFKFTGTAMGCIFFMASVFIVANTIRLLFYSRHEEFEIMRLVGATDGFIMAPFYIEGMIQGLCGGLTGILSLFVIFIFITSNIDQGMTASLVNIRFIPMNFSLGILIGSIFAGWLGCYLSLKQFLRH